LDEIALGRGHRFRRNKFVANSVNGLNKSGTVRIVLDFLSQSHDAIVDSAATGAFPVRPQGGDESLARYDNSRPGNQELQHFELPNSQPNWLISPTKLHLWKIQEEFPKLRSLTNSTQLKIDHVPVCGCHEISLIMQLNFGTQLPCHKTVILLLNSCSWKKPSNPALPINDRAAGTFITA
jgi:hypothetical protein